MNILGKKNKSIDPSQVILSFVQSWDLHGRDEVSISSNALDLLRAYIGDRPCCVWKNFNKTLSKISERGMVEILFTQEGPQGSASLSKVLVSGAAEFEPVELGALVVELKASFDGFLHVPIKIKDSIVGIFTVAVTKKESRDREFVQPLECLGRLLAIAFQHNVDQELSDDKTKRLKAEVEATTRELEQTNKRLIDRVRELKTLSSELERKVGELTVANKAKDEFLSIVSHELRTPLTSLKGFLCVLLDEEAGAINEAQKKFLGIAKQSADRLNVLISDLLDISRIESGRLTMDMKVCSLFDILHTSVEGLKSVAETKNIQIRFESNPLISKVWGDMGRLRQVIDNLITNAIKFTGNEGIINVFTEEKGDFIEVGVRDTGPGLSPEDQKKVFDMFYQVDASSKRNAGGVGLGLAIARGIIALHGGNIWIESEVGKGCTFKFMVPLSRARKAA